MKVDFFNFSSCSKKQSKFQVDEILDFKKKS